jgi:hypothetical protein
MILLTQEIKYDAKKLNKNSAKKIRLCRLPLSSNVKLKPPHNF